MITFARAGFNCGVDGLVDGEFVVGVAEELELKLGVVDEIYRGIHGKSCNS
jgi:hypothetical protein